VEKQHATDESDLVRCLDCSFVYELPLSQEEAGPCPYCGGVSWIALDAGHNRDPESDS
jgi:hypothetical protein